MYAVCSEGKQNDVADAVREMVSKKYRLPIFQFNVEKYTELDNDHQLVMDACREVQGEAAHVVNLGTRTLHKKKCPSHGKKVVGALIINVKTAGLKVCKTCMK